MVSRIFVSLGLVIALLVTAVARGEVFLLSNGGRLEGEWLNRASEPVEVYQIQTTSGARVTLAKEMVTEVVVKTEAELQYEAELPKMADTVEGHWDMAQRCRRAGLRKPWETHLTRVLELAPDHAEARYALGYSRVDGEWVKAEEWMTRQGYVRHKGGWRLPQEVELEARKERQEQEEREWRKRLRTWRTTIARGRDDSQEAWAKLQAVDSPFAVSGLAEMLAEKDEVKPLKLVYIDLLGRFDNSRAAAALLERVMTDPDLEVRERSIAALKQHGSQQALAFFTRSLKDKNNQVVNHAAWALGLLGDPAAIPALIDAVVTKHRFQVSSGGAPGSMNAAFGSGGTGFQPGGRPKIVEQSFNNSQALAALRSLVPEGINFGYNPVAWKDWWAREQIDPEVNLRRDF